MFKFDADLKTVDAGVWAEFQGSRFLIAHTSNLKFQRALSRLQQPYRRKLETGTLDPKINRDIITQAMAEGILLNWENVVDAGDVQTPYTPERGNLALKSNPEFRDFVSEYAMNLDNFKQEEITELGNG